MTAFVVLIHIVACLFLIGVVLLQQGKGSDLAAAFGGGTQTVFGSRGSVTLLHRLTTAGFIIFILTSVFLGVFQRRHQDASVMKAVQTETQKETPAAPKAAEPKPAESKPAEAPPVIPPPAK